MSEQFLNAGLLPHWKQQNIWITKYFWFPIFNCWTQHVFSFTAKSPFPVVRPCAVQVYSFGGFLLTSITKCCLFVLVFNSDWRWAQRYLLLLQMKVKTVFECQTLRTHCRVQMPSDLLWTVIVFCVFCAAFSSFTHVHACFESALLVLLRLFSCLTTSSPSPELLRPSLHLYFILLSDLFVFKFHLYKFQSMSWSLICYVQFSFACREFNLVYLLPVVFCSFGSTCSTLKNSWHCLHFTFLIQKYVSEMPFHCEPFITLAGVWFVASD